MRTDSCVGGCKRTLKHLSRFKCARLYIPRGAIEAVGVDTPAREFESERNRRDHSTR